MECNGIKKFFCDLKYVISVLFENCRSLLIIYFRCWNWCCPVYSLHNSGNLLQRYYGLLSLLYLRIISGKFGFSRFYIILLFSTVAIKYNVIKDYCQYFFQFGHLILLFMSIKQIFNLKTPVKQWSPKEGLFFCMYLLDVFKVYLLNSHKIS